jgi:rhodanese-related sulfurtransferase
MTRFSTARRAALGAALALVAGLVQAAEAPADPAKQTRWGLYLTSVEAAAMKQQGEGRVLFVDVRDPIEIMFTGFAPMVDVNIPLLLANRGKLHPEKPVFAMENNPTFADEVMGALGARGLGEDAFVILMCRSGGERGAPSAKALEGTGLKNVFVVVDGFEGDASKADPKAPWRNVNGWKNAGLPWSYALDPEKVRPRP